MSRSRFLSITSLLLLAAGTACCGGGDSCGPGSAAADGLTLAGTGVDVTYTMLAGGANNDCPASDAPPGVISLTIEGTQTGTSFPVTFCIPRPDKLGSMPLQLGTDVEVVDLGADIGGGCTLALAKPPAAAPAGVVTATGICDDGTDKSGFAMTIAEGTVSTQRTCGATVDELDLALSGTFAVGAQ